LIKYWDAKLVFGSRHVLPRYVLISPSLCRLPAWSLFGGDGADDEPAAAAGRERRLRPSDGGGDERVYLRPRQDVHGLKANEARLIARAKEQVVRIGQPRAMDKAQTHAVGPGRHGDN